MVSAIVLVALVKCSYTAVMNAQLLSQADINNGTDITFPMEGSDLENVSASSKVPTAAISN